jgi:hypothetical protein
VRVNHVHVFFYGLFMDEALLRERGLEPRDARLAALDDFALRIGQRATLVPAPGSSVHGVAITLTVTDLERLYSEPSVQAYRPQPVRVRLHSGGVISALCYILPQAPCSEERNPQYAARLRELAERIGLPTHYVSSIGLDG